MSFDFEVGRIVLSPTDGSNSMTDGINNADIKFAPARKLFSNVFFSFSTGSKIDNEGRE
ncbi:MAG TPA: hypothetical protein PKX63_09650 [Niabella sp.]|nr:hypothetical protein [Niabella sp.]